MSQHADPSKAYLWLDCDAYRGLAGMDRPNLTDLSPGAEYPGLDPFGGLEAGFSIAAEGAATPKRVMNYREAPYKVSRAPKVDTITLRSVDNSKARIDTLTQGGEILEYPDGTIELRPGTAEEFSLLLVVRDGTAAGAYWSDRVTLANPPAEGAVNGEDLDGSEFQIMPLTPLRKIWGERPEVLTEDDVTKVDATGNPLTAPGA